MPGGSLEHNAIRDAVALAVGRRLDDTPCLTLSPDLRGGERPR